jgi:Uma2 family endonuclease
MATKTQVRAGDYLRMTFEHDAEFVHGEIVERPMPDYIHGRIEILLGIEFGKVDSALRLNACAEVRMRLASDVYRIPDVAVFVGDPSNKQVPDTPPLVVIEILSKDDRYLDLMEKLEEFRQWGIPHIWVIDPSAQKFSIYSELGLHNVSSFALPEYSFQLTPAELFANL